MEKNKFTTVLTAAILVILAWNVASAPVAFLATLVAVGIVVAHTVFGVEPTNDVELEPSNISSSIGIGLQGIGGYYEDE